MAVQQLVVIPYTKTITDQRDRPSKWRGEAAVELTEDELRFVDQRTRQVVLEVSSDDLREALRLKGVWA